MEKPYLLDPTEYGDPLLISFNNLGFPVPTMKSGTLEYIRAKMTINILYLDRPYFNDAGLQIWNRCERTINQILEMTEHRDCTSTIYEGQIKKLVDELREMKSAKSEFSSTVIACLSQSKFPLAKMILSQN